MPRGLNRSGDFRNGTPITLPHTFGTPITLPHDFGNDVTWTPDPAHFGNPVTWLPDPSHFGNPIGNAFPPTGYLLQADGVSRILLASGGAIQVVGT